MKVRVLLVDDDEDDYLLTNHHLARSGRHELVWRNTPELGLEALHGQGFDVCLLDHQLGPSTGLEFLAKALRFGCTTPIVLLTGSSDGQLERDAMSAGAMDFLVKATVDADRLERTIRHAIDRAHTTQRLRESEARYRSIVETTPQGVLMLDEEGRAVFANDRAGLLLGQPAGAIAGRHLFEYMDEATSNRAVKHLIRRGERIAEEVELPLLRCDGSEIWCRLTLTPIYVLERFVGSLALITDVTETRRLQARLVASDRLASVGTLAAGVAHEINNPLAFIVSNVSFAMESFEERTRNGGFAVSPEEVSDIDAALRDARVGCERLRDITRDLKLFARGDDGRRSPMNVRTVIESTANISRNEIRPRARLVIDCAENLPPVDGNESRLGQVVLNLLLNAAQALPEGASDRNEIQVRTFVEAGRVKISVRDTGSGIPAAILPKIFEPFFTTKPPGVGTGLGLSICHGIVTAMGGELAVTSTVGKGTTFTVSLVPSDTVAESKEQRNGA